jgi:hypothetical protein
MVDSLAFIAMIFHFILVVLKELCTIAYIDSAPSWAFDFEGSPSSYFAKTTTDTAAFVLGFLGTEAFDLLAFVTAGAYPYLASCFATCGWDISHYSDS